MNVVSIIIVATAVVALLAVLAFLMPKAKPPSKFFTCARCKATSQHSPRTIEAWRSKKTRFYCQSCHRQWLEANPQRTNDFSTVGTSNRSGCLGALILASLLPTALALAWRYA